MEMSYTQEVIATQKKVADVMLEDNTRKQLRCAPALGAGCGEGIATQKNFCGWTTP